MKKQELLLMNHNFHIFNGTLNHLNGYDNPGSASALKRCPDNYFIKLCNGREMLTGIFTCLNSVTIKTRMKYLDELYNSEKQLWAIINAVTDAIILVDDCGKIIFSNPALEMIFGYSSKELKGSEIQMLFAPETFLELSGKNFIEFYETGQDPAENKIFEFTAIKKNHARIPMEISVSGMKINAQWHTVLVVRDISERKKLQEENIRVEKLELQHSLTGGITHDFNNLLQIITGNIELAQAGIKPKAGISKYLNNVLKASLDAKKLIEQYSMLSKNKTPVMVMKTGCIKNVLRESTVPVLSGVDIKYDLHLPEDLWQVKFDKDKIRQVLKIVMVNAAEAMPDGGTIIIKAENIAENDESAKQKHPFLKGRHVKISICDRGTGIPRESLTRMFLPYFTTKPKCAQKGMGLSLAITHAVITKHKGKIAVESKLGTGTAFAIYLPVFEKKKSIFFGTRKSP